MDRTTAEAYAKAYHLTVDDVLGWFATLPPEQAAVMAEVFRTRQAPIHSPADYRLWEQGMESWDTFCAGRRNIVEAHVA